MTEKLSNLSRVLYDKAVGEFLIGNDIGYDGETVIQQFVQSSPASIWEVPLNIRGFVVLAFVFKDNGNGSFTLIQPKSLSRIDQDDLLITFSEGVAGVANIILATDGVEKFQGQLTPTPTLTRTVTPTPQPTISVTPTVTPTLTPSGTPVGQLP